MTQDERDRPERLVLLAMPVPRPAQLALPETPDSLDQRETHQQRQAQQVVRVRLVRKEQVRPERLVLRAVRRDSRELRVRLEIPAMTGRQDQLGTPEILV